MCRGDCDVDQYGYGLFLKGSNDLQVRCLSLVFLEGAVSNDSASVYAWFHFFVNVVLVIRVIAVLGGGRGIVDSRGSLATCPRVWDSALSHSRQGSWRGIRS